MATTVRAMTETTDLTGAGTFTSWDETPGWDSGAPVPRLAHALVAFSWTGGIEGTSTCHSVIHYQEEAAGVVVGLERLTGRVDGEPGEVVLRNEGTFGADGVTIAWTVVPGSGTGALAGVTGGGYTAGPHAKEWTWRLGVAG